MATQSDSQPRHYTQQARQRLQELINHLREDVEKVGEPQAQALFETSAEVLTGLVRAMEHYEQKSEPAWQASA